MTSIKSLLNLRNFLLIVTIFLITDAAASTAKISQVQETNTDTLLSTPRRTVHTFLHWQQKGHYRAELFTLTMQKVEAGDDEKADLANNLLKVLNARGLIINYSEIPDIPNYTDSLSGMQKYILFSELPEVFLLKEGDRWVFSEHTIDQIPALYRSTFSVFVDVVLDELPESWKQQWMGLELWQYAAIFIWILAGLVLMKIFDFILYKYIKRLTEKTKTTWDDRLFEHVHKPLGYIFLFIFYWLTYSNLMLSVTVNHFLSIALEVATSVGFVWLFFNLSNVISDYLSSLTAKTESKLDDQLVPLIRKSLKIFIVIIGVIFVLQNNGINVASLLAGLGLGGLAFALAARDTLANFFGSVTIFLDKPFQIGDWVKSGNIEGTVEEVGFRSTRIRTFYNSLISVPNATLANSDIDNLGLREYRRYKATLNLTYSTQPEQIEAFVEGIKAIVNANPHMRQDFFEVHFNDFGSHSLDILVYVFFKVPTWSDELQQRHNFLTEILRLAKEVGVEFAFPTQTLHVDSFYSDEPRKAGEERTTEELASTVYAFGPNGEKSIPDGVRIYKNGEEVNFGAHLKTSGS